METTRYKLKDILIIKNGKDHSLLETGDYPVIGSGGVMRYANQYLYNGESVLLPRKGTLDNIQYINGPFWTVDTCYYTEIDTKIVNPYYLYRHLRSLDLSGLDSGASIPSMTSKCYYGIKIDLPNLDTQKRIADILSAYDDLIENNNRRISLLEKAAQELYKEWFVRFRFPGHETATFENGLPEGWQVRRVGDISKIGSGGDAPKDYSPVRTPEYSVPIFSNGITNDGVYGFAKKGTKKEKSITISARGTVGFTCLRFEPYLPIVRLLSIEPDNKDIDVYYLYYNLRNDIIDGYGTSQQQITIPFFSKKKIIVPPMALQNQYAAIVEEIYNQINKLKDMNNNLVKQRDLLLPRLMSGKLEV